GVFSGRRPAALAPSDTRGISVLTDLQEGDNAPLFTLPTTTGDELSLADLQGRNVILYFYPEDDTPGCTKEACQFRDTLPDFSEADAVVLGVSPDDVGSHQRFAQKFGLNFTLLAD